KPPGLVHADDRVAEEDVVEAGVREDLGLGDLGEREPAGAGRDLQAADEGRLVGLGVRAQLYARGARALLHRGDVPLDDVEVDQHRGGREVLDSCRARHFALRKSQKTIPDGTSATIARKSVPLTTVDRAAGFGSSAAAREPMKVKRQTTAHSPTAISIDSATLRMSGAPAGSFCLSRHAP